MRHFIALLTLVCLVVSVDAQAPPRVRPNIDDPTFDLALYKRAIAKLKADGTFDRMAQIHNGTGGPSNCQHHNEIFLTWHRALLFEFERALQEADPPDTRALMIPYWNWGEKASGAHFPKAFENDPDRILDTTGTGAPVNRAPGQASQWTFTTVQLRDMIRNTATWRPFAGPPCQKTQCRTGPCARCDPESPNVPVGAFEWPFHDQTHIWTGGPMLDDATAAVDPLFWSFHAYVDLVFDCWQRNHPGERVGCPDCPLRGLPGWTPARVESTAALGYTYDFRSTPCGDPRVPFVAAPALEGLEALETPITEELHGTMLLRVEKSAAGGAVVVDFTMPAETFSTAHLRVAGLPVFHDYNYTGTVYLYPASAALRPEDAAFARQYRAGRIAVWGNAPAEAAHAEHGEHEAASDIDVTTELKYLSRRQAGTPWKIAVVIDRPTPQPSSKRRDAAAEVLRAITIDNVSIVYDRDLVGGGAGGRL